MEHLGLRLVDGRMLDETDHGEALPSVVVSQALAEALWPGDAAVGKRIVNPSGEGWRTVVGVVSDARMRGMGRTHSQMLRDFYVTFDQLPHAQTNIFLRPRGDRAAAIAMVRDAVRSIDPTLPLFDVSTMEASMAEDRREMGLDHHRHDALRRRRDPLDDRRYLQRNRPLDQPPDERDRRADGARGATQSMSSGWC